VTLDGPHRRLEQLFPALGAPLASTAHAL